MVSSVGSEKAATGHNRIPIANERNPKIARKRGRWELNDILYPGALTSRLKRYAAEPAPDSANLTSISERTANGAGNPPAPLLPKRISQLPDDLRGHLFVLAIIFRQPVFRHPEGPEQDVPDRERPGKVGIAALFQRGVMPAVKHRRRQHVFERAKRPAEIGVNERRMERREWPDPKHDVRRDTRHQQYDVDHDGTQEQVHRVEARRRNPIQILGGMVDRMIFPEPAAMKQAVQPIQHEVRQKKGQHP